MGIAAYNRGSHVIREQLNTNARPVEFEIIDRLNSLEKYPDAGTPFEGVVILFSNDVWWVECVKTGFGFAYDTLSELVRRWNITITGYSAVSAQFTAVPTE